MARDCRGPKKNKGRDNLPDSEKTMKIIQEVLVKCNSKQENFQKRKRLQDELFPIVTGINVK